MKHYPVLFYSPYCPICPNVIKFAVEHFSKKDITLMIRMPNLQEKILVTGLPALFIPKELWNLDQPYLLIGSDIPKWLKDLDKQLNGNKNSI